jgi:hypothetical protein
VLPRVNWIKREKAAASMRTCRLAGQLGMNPAADPCAPASLAGTGDRGTCPLCGANTACCEAPQDGQRPSCANADILQEMLYRNLLWRQ